MNSFKPAARILVVDDDRGLLRLAEKALARAGHKVATADSGAKAVQWLTENVADLLLLDLKLEDTTAAGLIAQLTERQRRPHFLIITGQGDERVAVEMMKSGARDYVVKSADFLDLCRRRWRRRFRNCSRRRSWRRRRRRCA